MADNPSKQEQNKLNNDTKEIALYEIMLRLDKLLKLPQPVSIETVRRNHALLESIHQLKAAFAVYEKYAHELNSINDDSR